MPITYNPACATDLDRVRALIGDTDTTANPVDEALDDGEVQFCLAQKGDIYPAAAQAARMLAAKFDRMVDVQAGDYRESFSQRAKGLRETAAVLEAKGGVVFAVPVAGGISKAAEEAGAADPDLVQPQFKIGKHDNERAVLETDDRLGTL